MAFTGSCMCGGIAYESTSEPLATALCHCIDCQKWTGSAFTSNAVIPKESFRTTKGSPEFYDVMGASGKNNRHWFCAACGSSLFTTPDAMPGKVLVKAGGLNGGKSSLGKEIGLELYTKDRVGYLGPVAGAAQHSEFL